MNFNEIYTSESEKIQIENKDKKVLSDDAFAIGSQIENLIKTILRKW